MYFAFIWFLGLAMSLGSKERDDRPVAVQIDFAQSHGRFRSLHGINKGPLAAGGLLDVSEPLRLLKLPFLRLHDCHWPNPDVVDMHVVFPREDADPARPESYDFKLTDEYIAAAQATGAQIIYRLGESIEHTTIKRFVHPPKDPERWAAAALGIVRHYNEGWANGFRYSIRYWEIWNEPENRPAMWSGTDEGYFRLYQVTARSLKARFPDLKVGGPAVGNPGSFVNGVFQPTAFVTNFLKGCQQEKLPLDFFSWHCYTADPAELVLRAVAIRRLLDSYGFTRTESHLTEWNYLPDNSWDALSRKSLPLARQQFAARMGGAEGAAFLAAALVKLQAAPVDVCALFHGETGDFGLFTEHGVPKKSYHALRAIQELVATPQRVAVSGELPDGCVLAAGIAADMQSATVILVNAAKFSCKVALSLRNLPWKVTTVYDLRKIDATNDLELITRSHPLETTNTLTLQLQGSSISLITLRAVAPQTALPKP